MLREWLRADRQRLRRTDAEQDDRGECEGNGLAGKGDGVVATRWPPDLPAEKRREELDGQDQEGDLDSGGCCHGVPEKGCARPLRVGIGRASLSLRRGRSRAKVKPTRFS
jgi:hypothetical protein